MIKRWKEGVVRIKWGEVKGEASAGLEALKQYIKGEDTAVSYPVMDG